MSFCLIARPPLALRFLTLWARMPCRRRAATATVLLTARISPRTSLPFLSRPSQTKYASWEALALASRGFKVAMIDPGLPELSGR